MNHIDFWKACDEYTIVQAAIIITGGDPELMQDHAEDYAGSRPKGYIAIRTAIYTEIQKGTLKANIVEYDEDNYGNGGGINPHKTTIHFKSLDAFLKSRNMVCAFFDRPDVPSWGAPTVDGRHVPPKLDAANKAWAAVTADPSLLAGKSPKQALQKWLTEHAKELGLLNRRGQPNQTGIDEICKVANWKPEDGATPTQAATPPAAPAPSVRPPFSIPTEPRESFSGDLDDEIPF